MKFEKHLKSTGINGVIYKATNGNLFLRNGVFGNVLMRIPKGCTPISSTSTRNLDWWMNDLVINGRTELGALLTDATIEAEGAPKDIKRIYRPVLFDGSLGSQACRINQDAYSLIERYDDIHIYTPRGSHDESAIEHEIPVLVICNKNEETIAIILGE